jgi:hypothetical protein
MYPGGVPIPKMLHQLVIEQYEMGKMGKKMQVFHKMAYSIYKTPQNGGLSFGGQK